MYDRFPKPWMMSSAKLMTGMDPDDDSFKRRQLTLVRTLLESLAPSASSRVR